MGAHSLVVRTRDPLVARGENGPAERNASRSFPSSTDRIKCPQVPPVPPAKRPGNNGRRSSASSATILVLSMGPARSRVVEERLQDVGAFPLRRVGVLRSTRGVPARRGEEGGAMVRRDGKGPPGPTRHAPAPAPPRAGGGAPRARGRARRSIRQSFPSRASAMPLDVGGRRCEFISRRPTDDSGQDCQQEGTRA